MKNVSNRALTNAQREGDEPLVKVRCLVNNVVEHGGPSVVRGNKDDVIEIPRTRLKALTGLVEEVKE